MSSSAPSPSAGIVENVRLYQVLGLRRRDATPAEIKKAYRSKAVKCHPDRNQNDPDATAKFQAVQYAYSVLSNEQMKRVYDTYGEQGLKVYEGYRNFADGGGEGEGGPGGPLNLPDEPLHLLSAACVCVAMLVGIVTALMVTLYMKLSGATDAPLSMLLIPLWMLDCVALLALYILVYMTARKGAPGTLGSSSLQLLGLTLFIVWQILLVIRTDGASPTLPYSVVFAPLYVIQAIHTAKAVGRCRWSSYESERATGGTSFGYKVYVFIELSYVAARVALLMLVVLKLDKAEYIPWGLVFLPAFLYCGVSLLLLCAALQGADKEDKSEKQQLKAMVQNGQAAGLLLLLLLLLFVVLNLDGSIHTWLPIFMIPFILSGLFCCCCCCCVTAIRFVGSGASVEIPPADGSEDLGTERSGGSTGRSGGKSDEESGHGEGSPLLPGGQKGGAGYRTSAKA